MPLSQMVPCLSHPRHSTMLSESNGCIPPGVITYTYTYTCITLPEPQVPGPPFTSCMQYKSLTWLVQLLCLCTVCFHLYREVIERKPEEFKSRCLEQIKALFSDSRLVFHAGFGNKHSVSKLLPHCFVSTSLQNCRHPWLVFLLTSTGCKGIHISWHTY